MYQYSLKYFSQVFCNVIRQDHPKQTIEERISQLKLDELKAIFENVSRGLFENHKIIFSFLLATAIEKQESRISQADMNFLTRGRVGAVPYKEKPSNISLTDEDWETCLFLEEELPAYFKGFPAALTKPFYLEILNTREVIYRYSKAG